MFSHGAHAEGASRQRGLPGDVGGGDAGRGTIVLHAPHPRLRRLRPVHQAVGAPAAGPRWHPVRDAAHPSCSGKLLIYNDKL